jgi:hypothetical protein
MPGLRGPNTRVIPADKAGKTTALTLRRASRRPLAHTTWFNNLNINLMKVAPLRQRGSPGEASRGSGIEGQSA